MINIRLARSVEIKILNEIIALSARELSRDDYSEQEITAAIQYVFGVDTNLVNDKTYFVIEKDGEIAGCGGWSKRKTLFGGDQLTIKAEAIFLDPLKDAAKIRAFFIHPKFARQGLGSILLKHCEHEAMLHGFTQLEMMATLPGEKLYKTFDYKNVSDELVMLPNKISLRFVRMKKNLTKLTVASYSSEKKQKTASTTLLGFFKNNEASNQGDEKKQLLKSKL